MKEINNIVFIYGLIDPISLEVRYVGKTNRLVEERLGDHIYESTKIMNKTSKRKNINRKYSWIISLLKKNKKPTTKILEITDELNWQKREIYWIAQFKNLTNMTPGGDGNNNKGKVFGPKTESQKRYISVQTKIGMNSDEVKAKCRVGSRIRIEKNKRVVIVFDNEKEHKRFNSIGEFKQYYNKGSSVFKKLIMYMPNKECHIQLSKLNKFPLRLRHPATEECKKNISLGLRTHFSFINKTKV